jgi:hypothetical protein
MIISRRMGWAEHIAHRGAEDWIQGFGGKGRRKNHYWLLKNDSAAWSLVS